MSSLPAAATSSCCVGSTGLSSCTLVMGVILPYGTGHGRRPSHGACDGLRVLRERCYGSLGAGVVEPAGDAARAARFAALGRRSAGSADHPGVGAGRVAGRIARGVAGRGAAVRASVGGPARGVRVAVQLPRRAGGRPPFDGDGDGDGEVDGCVDGEGDGETTAEGVGEGAPAESAVTPMSSASGNCLTGWPLSASPMYSVQISAGMSPPWREGMFPTPFMEISFLSAELGSVRKRTTEVDSSGV